jgi:hypothetical protein
MLTLKCQLLNRWWISASRAVLVMAGQLSCTRSGGFYKGRWPVRWSRDRAVERSGPAGDWAIGRTAGSIRVDEIIPPQGRDEGMIQMSHGVAMEMNMLDDIEMGCYIFSGRIYPERYGLGINPISHTTIKHYDGALSRMRISIFAGQVTATVHTDSTDSMYYMKNRVSRQVRNLADSAGFIAAAAFDVEITTCISPDGSHTIFNTAFPDLTQHTWDSAESQRVFNLLVGQAGTSAYVRMALSDLRNAIREPLDTCVNCYRAIESIRQEYLVGDVDDKEARKQSWVRLREATGATESDLDWLKELATPRRHGASIDEPEEQRARALRIAKAGS